MRGTEPARRNHSRQRAARVARIRRHNKIQRPINDSHNRLHRARRKEIANRKGRNRMRKTLFVRKGRPSTSPFCTWINEPLEPEELPPNWRPPPNLRPYQTIRHSD
jgi:hypothetical protein